MSNNLGLRCAATLCLCMLTSLQLTHAEVRLQSWLSRDEQKSPSQVYVNEPLRLNIDIATDYWFSGPTQIEPLPQDNVIAPSSAISFYNYSQPDDEGRRWSHQHWEIPIFVPRAGRMTLPALAISVQDANEDGPAKRVVLHSSPITLDAIMPPLMDPATHWLAAPDAQLRQSWHLSQKELHVGDSIQRQVDLQAKETLSLLLPALLPTPSVKGAAIYPDPVRYNDQTQQGALLASRSESITYLLQQSGSLTLPPIQLQWWNSQLGKMESLRLEGQTFHVHPTFKSWLSAHRRALLLYVALGLLSWRFYRPVWNRLHLAGRWVERQQTVRFGKALWQADWPRCRQLIYQRLQTEHHLNCLRSFSSSPPWRHRIEQLNSDAITRSCALICWWQLHHFTSTIIKRSH